jgi:tetratricopeptide (TPR) repeat protein
LGWAYEQKSMIKEALVEFQTAVSHWKDGSLPLGALGHAYGIAGQKKEAQEILEKLLEMSKQTYVPAYDIAAVYVGLGENAQAFEWLSKALEERSGFLIYIKCDRRFDGLRSDPRYEALLNRIGLPLRTIKTWSLDWRARKAEWVCSLPPQITAEVLAKSQTLLIN